ncbi:TPA: tyrosine-type recombinase/integrase [Streptococcus suis]
MSISYQQRGKKKLWNYRIFDKNKKLVASKGGFRTKSEAKQVAIAIELNLLKGYKIDNSASISKIWEQWYELQILPQKLKESTLKKHVNFGKQIKKYFGDTSIRDIKPSEYQKFINSFAEKNVKETVSRLNNEVKKILTFAKNERIFFHDFTEQVIITGLPPKKMRYEKYIHSKADYFKLLGYLTNNAKYEQSVIPYLLFIQLKTGMRFAEVLGLTWDCVNWNEKTINTYRRYDSTHKKWTEAKTPDSIREIPVDDDVLSILHRIKIEQGKYYLVNPDNMLFVNFYTGIPTNNACNKHLQAILKKLEIKPQNLTCTGIRHTFASILISEGIDLWVLAKIMGHKDIRQIIETYGHLIKEKEKKENERIRNLLKIKNSFG